ncbi:hypothetical protein LX32DRAFT_81783 [Colletotrichum zoysiae]|uniref:Uncharacterized protein n=1 Tax=Colletotrichum zoysiae TaxID=1216348 RepID=A0AAD9M0N7_9PEZI|nr:hypothetical protein LX32DRAFT_81783 [Colletotrichum zoysiae]
MSSLMDSGIATWNTCWMEGVGGLEGGARKNVPCIRTPTTHLPFLLIWLILFSPGWLA